MKSVVYYPLYVYMKLHAFLPMRVLYILSDILYFPLYYVVRYRRKVVRNNLTESFPEKKRNEIEKIEKAFYHHFCDYVVETVKLMHISDEEMKRRMVFEGLDMVEGLLKEDRLCLLTLGHYGNWEWVPSVTRWIPGDYTMGQIYRPLKNRWFDAFFLKLRARFDSVCISKQDSFRAMVLLKRSGKASIVGFIADQTPSAANIHHWVPFLNHETAVLTGPEKIAVKLDTVVLYLDIEVVKRGYYKGTFRLITDNAKNTAEFEITDEYMKSMEKTICRAPQYWLWSHRRWKHKKENFNSGL